VREPSGHPTAFAVFGWQRDAGRCCTGSSAPITFHPADPSYEWYRYHHLFGELLGTSCGEDDRAN
jgi:hypothetical protein